MKKRQKMSKRTILLLVAAMLLLSVGTYTGTKAELEYISNVYRTHFYLNHLQVHLLENGEDVCGHRNNLNGEAKVTGALATKTGYKSENGSETLGSIEPGMAYDEEIRAENRQDVSEFVRMTIRKYWVVTDKDGNVVKVQNAAGKMVPKKTTDLRPDQIILMYQGSEECNPKWQEIKQETTDESTTYIYTDLLKGGERTAPIFDQLKIDKSVAAVRDLRLDEKRSTDSKKIYTVFYQYDGYAFYIEAEVQAIQTHNAQDAIESQWGPYIKATYSEQSDTGSLEPRN